MKILTTVITLLIVASCSAPVQDNRSDDSPAATFPEKAKDMTIYEVNIRQHTQEGTFAAFQEDLPRLKDLGVDMLWIMPIQPIGIENRKGSLGSYYSIRDYKSANPEFGTLEDFKSLVNKAHEQGFQIILDWVPNHTAWDHTWITEHPEYYMTDSAAQIINKNLKMGANYYKKKGIGDLVYEADWDDIALLNLYNPNTRTAMIDAMKYWVTETNIDGFRVDHPTEEIPLFFWEEATEAINPLKDLFWLAERDEARVHIVFDASYEWGMLGLIEKIGEGEGHINADDLQAHILNDISTYGKSAFRLNMITNHDRNAWDGTIKERFGKAERAMAVLSYISYGVPVLYTGQEVGLDKRLHFFEKDTIDMSDPENFFAFYQRLNQIKAENPAIWNGGYGGMPEKLEDGNPEVFSTLRVKDGNALVGIINLSDKEQTVKLNALNTGEVYTDAFTGESIQLGEMKLAPWQYLVLTNKK